MLEEENPPSCFCWISIFGGPADHAGRRHKKVLHEEVRKHVTAGASIYTDALLSYEGLASEYAHQVVDHATQYVDGRVHTNGLENFWSLLKRGISETYVSVEPFHLFRYLDEQMFLFNNRKDLDDAGRFDLTISPACRQASHLCRANWQGGRNDSLSLGAESAGSGRGLSPLFLRFLASPFLVPPLNFFMRDREQSAHNGVKLLGFTGLFHFAPFVAFRVASSCSHFA